jgi:hypothetical protein
MEFEKFIAGNSKRPPCPCCRDATLGKSLSFFVVLNVCNHGQDTFIDYLILECGLGQVTSLMIFFSFNVVQPWARHFY